MSKPFYPKQLSTLIDRIDKNKIATEKKVQKQRICLYCNCEIKADEMLTREHLVPLCAGGSNDRRNVKPCCFWCNNKRGNYPLPHFLRIIKEEMKILLKQKSLLPSQKTELAKMNMIIKRVPMWIKYVKDQGAKLYRTDDHYYLYHKYYSQMRVSSLYRFKPLHEQNKAAEKKAV